jgi:hypothetical protein
MRRFLSSCLLAASILGLVAVAPVAAADTQAVSITVTTTFDEIPDAFTGDGLPDCSDGLVEGGPAHVQFAPALGMFAGFKVFYCAGTDSGFVLRLNARFGPNGSVGTWSVVDAWGSLDGMAGSGVLTGDPIEGGIIDHYEGTVVL